MPNPVKLYFREYGEPEQPALILLHGLLGSLVNWHSIAQKLSTSWRVIVPDLRNHGRSPHHDEMSYPAMAADILQLMDDLDLEKAVVTGHSMGGKAAMWLALQWPERVRAMVAVDIAPVSYPPRFEPVLEGLLAVPLDRVENRGHADALLSEHLGEKTLRDYLLQNLQRDGEQWRWRNNLPVLHANMAAISAFPEAEPGSAYEGPSLFIYGEDSNYVKSDYYPVIRRYFPYAQISGIENAGHWLYSERPRDFLELLRSYLNKL